MIRLEGEACFINKTIHATMEAIGAKLNRITENGRVYTYKRFVSRAASCQVDEISIHLERPIRWTIASKNEVTQEIGKRREWDAYAAYSLATAHDMQFFIEFFAERAVA